MYNQDFIAGQNNGLILGLSLGITEVGMGDGLPPPIITPPEGTYQGFVNVSFQSDYDIYWRTNLDAPNTFNVYHGEVLPILVDTELALFAFDPESKKFSVMRVVHFDITGYTFEDTLGKGKQLAETVTVVKDREIVMRFSDVLTTGNSINDRILLIKEA